MKLVKKLLRLLPFIYTFISVVLLFFVSRNESLFLNTAGSAHYSVSTISSELLQLAKDSIYTFFNWIDYSNFQLPNSIITWVNNSIGISGNGLNYLVYILFYELVLSLLFIMFDVFNFMLAIANKWIKKGGNLDD